MSIELKIERVNTQCNAALNTHKHEAPVMVPITARAVGRGSIEVVVREGHADAVAVSVAEHTAGAGDVVVVNPS